MLVRWQPQQQMTFDLKDHHCIVCHLSESEVYCSEEWSQSSSTASFSWPASASLAASSASAAAPRYWPCWQRLSKGRCQLCCCNCFSPLYLLRLRRHVEKKKKGGAAVAATPAALHPRKSVERSERSRREVKKRMRCCGNGSPQRPSRCTVKMAQPSAHPPPNTTLISS